MTVDTDKLREAVQHLAIKGAGRAYDPYEDIICRDVPLLIERLERVELANCKLRGDRDDLVRARRYEADRAERAERVLEDFAHHGMRVDTNPTLMFPPGEPPGGWQAYLARADEFVRSRAKEALRSIED